MIDSTLGARLADVRRVRPPGRDRDEVLLTTHVCHPSLANDNLSGIALLAELARGAGRDPATALRTGSSSSPGRSARSPGSRGTRTTSPRIVAGLVVACVGDSGPAHATSAAAAAIRSSTAPRRMCVAQQRRTRPRLRSVGMGRASVQLSRLRPPGRLLDPFARRRVRASTTRRPTTSTLIRPEHLEESLMPCLDDRGRSRARRSVRQPLAERRAAARQRGLYRAVGGAGPRSRAARAALGAEPVGRHAVTARHRGAIRPRVWRTRRRRARSPRGAVAGRARAGP